MKAPPSEAHPRKRVTDQKSMDEGSNPSTTTTTTTKAGNSNNSALSTEQIESSGNDGAALPSAIETKEGSDEQSNITECAPRQSPPTFRYTIEELLALRESHLVQAPADFSSNTPLRPGVQVKVAETNQGAGGAKSTAKGPYFGLEHIVKAQTDGSAGPQRSWPQTNRLQGASLRGVGIGRGTASAEVPGHEGAKAGNNSHHGRGSGSIAGTPGAKGHQDKGGGPQTGARHHGREHSGMETRSWRSTGNSRHNGSMHHGGGGYGPDSRNDGGGQPEWMDDSIAYDESQSAKRMQDLEEWKRRMREGAGGGVVAGNSGEAYMHGDQQLLADDTRAMRESRFLRLFSANEPQQGGAAVDPLGAAMPPEAHPQQLEGHLQQLQGSAVDGVPQQQEDQISKLFKVFGDKVSVSGHVDSAAMLASAAPQAQAQVLGNGTAAGEYAPGLNEATQAATQRVKSASPAPINEALRGIVPTSVFRKSVQPSSAPNTTAAAKRPESSASSRSGTPARNLPSWLVELSRGSASPSTIQPSATSGALGSRDLVHTLEQEFPALSLDPQQGDRQSISSLSVQASVGVPSEANGGSVRRGSGELHDADQAAGIAAVAGGGSTAQAAPAPSNVSRVTSAAPQEPMQMPPVVPPQGMMGVPPPPPHMMMTDGSMLPGMVNAPPMPGQMPPMGMVPPPGHPMGFHPNMMFGMMPPHGMYGGMAPPVNMAPPPQLNGVPAPTSEQQQHLLMMKMLSEMPPGMVFGQMGSALPQMPPTHIPAHTAGLPPMYTAAMTYPNMSAAVAAPGAANANGATGAASQAAAFAQPLQHPQQQHPQQQD
ncbi:hypothetical protein H4R20_003231 [Coemansia guatemalensis]|uniref:Uncharacterized protein n=1 Tax=Coemansia guatemalensis TaxID=2761395 RepID=A0A9W8LT84_9FUNG|nr:hypothetical protein H4R20_003231 [Coemansia guatemalensis]